MSTGRGLATMSELSLTCFIVIFLLRRRHTSAVCFDFSASLDTVTAILRELGLSLAQKMRLRHDTSSKQLAATMSSNERLRNSSIVDTGEQYCRAIKNP